jgi:NADH:ubiquinone oxidoreductase subunit 3 (subunit A)
VVGVVLIALLYIITFISCEKELVNEKSTTFERGFESEEEIQASFSIHFLLY